MIIDCHVHLQGAGIEDELVEACAALGVEKMCCSSLGRTWSYEPTPDIFVEANNDVAECMRRYPDLVLGFCYLNPMYEDESLAEMRRCIEDLGMVGVKLWVAAYADHPGVNPIVEEAIRYGIPVLQHAWHKATGNLPHESKPTHIASLARRYPEADTIMAHIAGDWEQGIEAVRDCLNVSVDTSGSIVDMGMVEHAVQELGARRVLFGSDAHGADLSVTVAKIVGAEISDSDKELVLGGNMDSILRRRNRR